MCLLLFPFFFSFILAQLDVFLYRKKGAQQNRDGAPPAKHLDTFFFLSFLGGDDLGLKKTTANAHTVVEIPFILFSLPKFESNVIHPNKRNQTGDGLFISLFFVITAEL
jgi:hypothetical protein